MAALWVLTAALFLLIFSPAFVVAILSPVDFVALQNIRKSLEDMPGSEFFRGWDFTGDPCEFPGVYCEGQRVVALNLGDPRAGSPGLSGRLNPAVGKLTALAELSLVPGRVIGIIPASLELCRNLRFLALSKNFIHGDIPAGFAALKQLQTLDLSYNLLSGDIPRSLGKLPALANLILCHNRLSGSVPVFYSDNLVRLDLKHNDLSGGISTTALPSSLQYLSLSYNRLAGPIDGLLPRLVRLNYLDLSMNKFTGSIPAAVFSFPISSLQLQRNSFEGAVEPAALVSIPTVDLSYNRLYGPVSPMLSTVQNLYLNNKKFTGHVPPPFVNQLLAAGIQTLYLQHNFLTGMEINPAAAIPDTSSLCLQYNCMVPPVQTPCPLKAGRDKTRPSTQCVEWRG